MPKDYPVKTIVRLTIVVIAIVVMALAMRVQAQGNEAEEVLAPIVEQVEMSGQFDYVAQMEQTLIPRPIPENFGKREERIDSQMTGEVRLPDFARLTLQFEAGWDAAPLTIEQDGPDTFLISGDERQQIENPLSPTMTDFVGYLHAAENVRLKESPEASDYTIYEYDISGPKFVEHLYEVLRSQIPADQSDATIQVPSYLEQMTGHGELWVDADGYPQRQIVDIDTPEANDQFDIRTHFVIDFAFDTEITGLPLLTDDRILGAVQSDNPAGIAGIEPATGIVARISAVSLPAAPEPAFVLAFLLTLAILTVLVVALIRPPRALKSAMPIALAVTFVISPILRPISVAKAQENAPNLPSLSEALGLDTTAAQEADEPVVNQMNPNVPIQEQPLTKPTACGTGNVGDDTDLDGLNDFVESCLGTDPYYLDTDEDNITDTIEIAGFVLTNTLGITQTFYSNPFRQDTNEDGLSDDLEWPAPIGDAPSHDPDGDDIPNLWDPDNDGDGVPDNVDLAPFSSTEFNSDFSLRTSLNGSTYNGSQYIDIQVQPQNQDHLRLSLTEMDWPFDDVGSIQARDATADDELTFSPVLKITTNNPPFESTWREYGITGSKKGNQYEIEVLLFPVSDAGNITAYQGRVYYSQFQLENIDWSKIELVWVAFMENSLPDGSKSTIPVAEYTESSFRITGLEVTKSAPGKYAVFGTPASQTNHRPLANLLLGLEASFLSTTATDFDEIVDRFSNSDTPTTETWGIPATDIAVGLPDFQPLHMDHMLQRFSSSAATIRKLLIDNSYDQSKMASVITILETQTGGNTMDSSGIISGNQLTFNLADIPLFTMRSVSLSHYTYQNGVWGSPSDADALNTLISTYQNDPATVLANLQITYPAITTEDMLTLFTGFYLMWMIGQVRFIDVDGVQLVETSRDDTLIDVQYDLPGVTDFITYVIEAVGLGLPGAGLIYNDPQSYYQYRAQAVRDSQGGSGFFAAKMTYTIGKALWDGWYVLEIIQKGKFGFRSYTYKFVSLTKKLITYRDRLKNLSRLKIKGLRVFKFAGTVAKAFPSSTRAFSIIVRTITIFRYVLTAVLFVVSMALIWVSYAKFYSPYGYERQQALAYAITETVLTIVFLIMGFFGFLIIFTFLFAILNLVVYLISSILGEPIDDIVTKSITSLVVYFEQNTKVEGVDFDGLQVRANGSGYFVAGSTATLSDVFKGRIAGYLNELPKLQGSDIYGTMSARAGAAIVTSTGNNVNGNSNRCVIRASTKHCKNDLWANFTFGNAGRDQKVEILYEVTAITKYTQYNLAGTIVTEKEDVLNMPSELKEEDRWSWVPIYLDVLPNTVDGLLNWSELKNNDLDADGVDNLTEVLVTLQPPNYPTDIDGDGKINGRDPDRDGDGLGDGFETASQNSIGSDPNVKDSDGDGLDDGLEYQLGTGISTTDYDSDGLSDSEEVFHWDGTAWSGGGWFVTIDGEDYWVMADPFVVDWDKDGVSDKGEKANGTSPYSYNDAPQMTLLAGPYVESPEGLPGVYVSAGQLVTSSLSLYNTSGLPVTTTLSLCLPPSLTNVNITTSGDRVPTTQVSGNCYDWDFSANNLLGFQRFQADVTALAGAGTLNNTISAALPFAVSESVQPMTDQVLYVEDNTAPTIQLTDPMTGTILNSQFYVVGGFAQDATSWVDNVQVTVPSGTYSATLQESQWGYTWELPPDGVVNVSAVAYDFLGNASAPVAIQVTVDTLAPVITINVADGMTVSAGQSYSTTIPISGTVTDNFAGIARVQLRYNRGPWRTIWDDDTNPLNANWSGVWELPTTDTAQGEHSIYLRAFDAFGNISTITRTLFIDVLPPTGNLTNRAFLQETPAHVPGGQPVPIYGVASDAGNNPLPADPAALSGNLNSITDATFWLQVDDLSEDDAGVTVNWLGDVNGDRLGDLAVGLPGANGGTGKVIVVNGSPGGWPVPNIGDLEFLKDNTPSYVGTAGAAIGTVIKPAGDVNGDGVDDMLIGDATNDRLVLILGSPASSVFEQLLDGTVPQQIEIMTDAGGETLTGLTATQVAGVGDVNNDGLGDIMVSVTGVTSGTVYLLPGDVSLLAPQTLDFLAAAVLQTGPAGASVAGVGDVNDDFIPDFAVAMGNTVYLFAGGGGWVQMGMTSLSTANAIATFATADSLPTIVGTGDMNGDGIDDFAFSSGSAPVAVFGNAAESFTTQTLGGFASPLSGFLAAVGDVDKDGRGDLLVGNTDDDAYLLSGANLSSAAATIVGVATAASAPYVAGADLAGDGSSDLAVVPTAALAANQGYDGLQSQPIQPPFISQDWLSAATAEGSTSGQGDGPIRAPGDVTVAPVGADYTSIQAAIDSGATRVLVRPGIYAEAITLTNNVTVVGAGADRTLLTFPGGVTPTVLVNVDGVTDAALLNLTLQGSGSGTGLQVSNGATNIRLERTVVQDMSTAVSVDGATTTLALKNNTVVGNVNGFAATNDAGVDIRNTIFAYNTGTAVQYDPGAVLQLHQYNLYFANGTDLNPNNPGGGEQFSDPLFLDYGKGDFRTELFSPVIDAGTPNDPVPPGAGLAIDIGHREQTGSSFFADDDYCDVCLNDGLIWEVDAFTAVQDAVDAAQADIDALQIETPIQFTVGVNAGIYTESVVISSSVQLIGRAPDQTLIQGDGGPAVTFQAAVNAGVREVALTGGGSDPIGILLRGGSNTIAIDTNLILDNSVGISVTQRSSGSATFNTIISNTTGVALGLGTFFNTYEVFPGPEYPRLFQDSCNPSAILCEERGFLWLDMANNVVSNNAVGLSAAGKSVLFSDNNLLFNTIDYTNVISGPNDLVGQDPLLTGAYGYLAVGSPAVDAASPGLPVPPGGGVRADLGWHELLAAPISVLMGQPDESLATESIGVGQVEYAIVPVGDPSLPITATLPTTWTLATLDNPGAKLTYWQTSYNAAGDGYYRFYSRASDLLGNSEVEVDDWYDGAFVVDSNTPVLTMTLSPGLVDNWLLMEAEVVDYIGDSFDIEEIYFIMNGQRLEARWAVEEWTPDGSSPRTFRYFFQNNSGVNLPATIEAFAIDGAGNVGSSGSQAVIIAAGAASWIDTIPPRSITITQPLPGAYVTDTVLFAGTVWDNGAFFSGVFEETDSKTASVALSFDGGVTWQPASSYSPGPGDPYYLVADRVWEYAWAVPGGLDATTIPVRVRATDNAGLSRSELITVTLDTAPPRQFTADFNLPIGVYMDKGEIITGTWGPTLDGSGWVTGTSVVENANGTVSLFPNTDYQVSDSGSEGVPVGFRFGVRDDSNNVIYDNFGLWKGGDVAGRPPDYPEWAGFQYLERDGLMDITHNEWLTPTELLDDDERPDRIQKLWTTWDSYSAYIGWQGASWGPDGTMWVYFDLFSGGSNLGITDGRQLPFDADFAVSAVDADTAYFWNYEAGSSSWFSLTLTTPDTNPFQPEYGHNPGRNETEIRSIFLDYLGFGTTANVDWSRMFAYATTPGGEVWSAFPTVNPLNGPFDYFYEWDNGSDPYNLLELPTAARNPEVSLSFTSDPGEQDTVTANDTILYVATLASLEDEDEPSLQLSLNGTPGLTYQTVTGAAAYDCSAGTSCLIDLPVIPALGGHVVTITAVLDSDLTSINQVTTTAQLEAELPVRESFVELVHTVDIDPPTVTINRNPGGAIGTGLQRVGGTASDGAGAGVALVEVSLNGIDWMPAVGTQEWSAYVTAPPGPSWTLEARAIDHHGLLGFPWVTVFFEDTVSPILTPTVPALVGGRSFAQLRGTVQDPAPANAEVASIAMQLDSSGAPWRDGIVYGRQPSGVQNWLYSWALPAEDNVTHTVRFRATDYGGNSTTSGWYTTTVDTIAPAVAVTEYMNKVVVGAGTPALAGTISDGSGVSQISAVIYPAIGSGSVTTVTVAGNQWSAVLDEPIGVYDLYVTAADVAGNSRLLGPFEVEVVDELIGFTGDPSCDGMRDVIDALYIMQFEVGLRTASSNCPPEPNTLYLPACDVSGDAMCTVIDALYIMQCEVGIANPLCPAAVPDGQTQEVPGDENGGSDVDIGPSDRRPAVLSVGSGRLNVGETVTIPVSAYIPPNTSGLSALTVDIIYDPAVVEYAGCQADETRLSLNLCNLSNGEAKESATVTFSALAVVGVTGDLSLGNITFTGRANGHSRLALSPRTFVYGGARPPRLSPGRVMVGAGITPGTGYITTDQSGTTLDGLAYDPADILRFDTVSGSWSLYFDGSEWGLDGANLDALHVRPDGSLLVSLAAPFTTVDDVTVGPEDLLLIRPRTDDAERSDAGRKLTLAFDGSDVGLEGNDVVGVAIADGALLLALRDPLADTPSAAVMRFEPKSLGEETSGDWAVHLDAAAMPEAQAGSIDALDDMAGLLIYSLQSAAGSLLPTTIHAPDADFSLDVNSWGLQAVNVNGLSLPPETTQSEADLPILDTIE